MHWQPFIDYTWHVQQFSERVEARAAGYFHYFIFLDGVYRCLSHPELRYNKNQLHITRMKMKEQSGELLLITTLDGFYKGTAVVNNENY